MHFSKIFPRQYSIYWNADLDWTPNSIHFCWSWTRKFWYQVLLHVHFPDQ